MQAQQKYNSSTLQTDTSLKSIQVDFMDIAHDLHQTRSESKKKDKARRLAEARRAIEAHQEKKQLEAALKEWWEEL